MKKVKLGIIFLRQDEAYKLLEAEQTGEKDGAAVEDKGDGELKQPVEVQQLGKISDRSDGDGKQEDMQDKHHQE